MILRATLVLAAAAAFAPTVARAQPPLTPASHPEAAQAMATARPMPSSAPVTRMMRPCSGFVSVGV